jgi:hypothetical protein
MIANTFMFLEHLITKYFFQFAYKVKPSKFRSKTH